MLNVDGVEDISEIILYTIVPSSEGVKENAWKEPWRELHVFSESSDPIVLKASWNGDESLDWFRENCDKGLREKLSQLAENGKFKNRGKYPF